LEGAFDLSGIINPNISDDSRLNLMNVNNLRLSEKLMYSTVRIEYTIDGRLHMGTGFIFEYSEFPGVHVIISNRHIAENSDTGGFVFNLVDKNDEIVFGEKLPFGVDRFSQRWYYHPDRSIDLAIMPVGKLFNYWLNQGIKPFITSIISTTIPNKTEWSEFHNLEEVLIIGYPDMIIDSQNNLPFSVKGDTATHPNIMYGGKEQFAISAGIYPGSSGSPIFLLNDMFYEKSRALQEGPDRARLLGIVYAGFRYRTESRVYQNESGRLGADITPKNQSIIAHIPMGIILAIKSTKLLDFLPRLREELIH
jgi:hypothetical protein